jgi:thioredoxin-related protein
MRWIFLLSLLLLGAGACSRERGSDAGQAEAPPLRWHTYLDMALQEAQRDNKNVMVAFFGHDCPLCKTMDDSVFADPEVRRVLEGLVKVRLEVEADSLSAQAYHVSVHPTVIFLHPDGSEIDRLVSYLPAQEFIRRTQNLLAGRQTFERMLADESEYRDDPKFLLELAQKLHDRGRREDALERLKRIPQLDPKNAAGTTDEALFLQGRIYSEQHRYEESIVPLERLIEEFPASNLVPNARLYRAMALLGIRGRGQEGVDELGKLSKEFRGNPVGQWADQQLAILSRGQS